MQWGIINGNDPFLYGEKVKAYLIRGARHLPGYDIWPNGAGGVWQFMCNRKAFLCGVGERANDYRSFPDTYRGVSAGQKLLFPIMYLFSIVTVDQWIYRREG